MKEGRDYEKLPELSDHIEFGSQWKIWWASLQPSTRRVEGSSVLLTRVAPADKTEWETLWRGGPCGLFLVVMGLAWWLYAASESDDSLEDVYNAIDDVHWAIAATMEAHEVTGKHAASNDIENTRPAKRPRLADSE